MTLLNACRDAACDISIGYLSHTQSIVRLYLQERLTFRVPRAVSFGMGYLAMSHAFDGSFFRATRECVLSGKDKAADRAALLLNAGCRCFSGSGACGYCTSDPRQRFRPDHRPPRRYLAALRAC